MIEPYQREVPRLAVGIVTESGTTAGEPDPKVLYVSHERANRLLTAGFGEAVCWNGEPIRLVTPDGQPAIVTRLADATDDETIDGLILWRNMLHAMGARVGSLGSASWSLMRASLPAPIHDSAGTAPPLHSVIGGRQELPHGPGRYHDVYHHDLSAAYARTLGNLTYGGAWDYYDVTTWRDVERYAQAGFPAFLSAEVTLGRGKLPYGPLPRRRAKLTPWQQWLLPAVYPRTGRIKGFWSAPEVIAAAEAGCRVKLRGLWLHSAFHQPFLRWWHRVQMLREAPGFAGMLGKSTGNALWGQLAITSGERTRITFARGRRVVTPDPIRGAGRPRLFDLAEYVTGTVRARLWADALLAFGPSVVAAHTDGFWSFESAAPAAEGWRTKDVADVLDIVNPQCYRFRGANEKTFTYRVAGVPITDAVATFGELWEGVTRESTSASR